ncbi:hypothetical protein TRFO_28095 [Tritrichomonas foetus]|uniref:USP domain-containing protein n=1 Tax=Tritrichomonas foetus TaxID=1144522 RepID=A0A1J4K0T6_9EUKA|nr:hypothetical protein TRFO_28095 [Tritrichomonas foetus]|eukprot:OHT04392.1 hypothetical protein TRFO_28095 [Tritrichomonas foetus]
MKDVYAQFGADLIIDLPLTAQVKTKPFYSPSTSLSCVTRSLSRPTDHSIGSSASLPARAFQSSIASMFYSFIFAFVQNTQIKEFALQYENHEFQDDSLLLSFIEYIQEVNRIPNTLVQPHQFSSLFFRLQPELGSVRYFDAAATVNGVINRLADEVPDGKPFKEIMSSRIIREEKCPKCGFSRPAEDLMPCFKLDIQSKVFRKATLMDCIAAFLQPKKIGHGKTDTCPKCHKKINLREQIKLVQLPNILMPALSRFIREGNSINKKSTEVNYTHELCMDKFTGHSGDNYELMSVVAHARHTIQQKAKVFIRDQADKEKWSFYNDSRAIVADSKSVILPGAAVVLIYQKCA